MRIIKHGNQYELGQKTCDQCKCVFAYNETDIKIERMRDYDEGTYGYDFYDTKCVTCPECHKLIKI